MKKNILRTAIVNGMTVGGCLTIASAASFESLVHHWNFDEGPDWHDDPFQSVATATVARDSVGSADATLQGMTGSAFVSGRQYTGMAFDGVNDTLQTATDLAPTLGGTASLSFWLRTNQTGGANSGSSPGIVGFNGVQWGWIDDAGKMVLSVDGTVVARSAKAINDNRWHHVVFTRNHSTGDVQVYVDGELSASGTGPTGTRSGTLNRLGHMQNGTASLFQGVLDQVHVFNGVVDAATVTTLRDNHAPKTWLVNSDGENSAPFTTDSVLVSSHAYDAEQDTLTLSSFTQPAHGTATHNGDGSFTYTATGGYTGADTFEVTISDGKGGYTTNTVNILVTGPPIPGSGNRTVTFSNFQAINAGGSAIALSGWRVPRAVDWDNDGDQDLLIGDDTGIWRYENTGTATAPVFAAGVKVQAGGADISLSGNILIALADMTGDGVDDLVAVNGERKIRVYANTAAAGQVPVYAAASLVPSSAGGDFVLPDQRFDAADWDGDGLIDLVMGNRSGEVRAYRNVGTASAALFDPANYEVLESGSYNLYPRVFDISRNNVPDYIRGINWGSINYWFDPSTSPGLGSQSGAFVISDNTGATADVRAVTDGAMVDFADFNGDGVLDVLIGGHAGSNIYLAYGVANTVADSIAAIEAIYDAHPTGLGAALEANGQALLNQINAAQRNIILHMQASTLSERQTQFNQMVTHVGKYTFLQMGSSLDAVEYNHLPSIAGQNLMTMHEMLPDTAAHRTSVANAVGLTGVHRDIYIQMGLHVGDNQQATQGQIESVRDFMLLQPRESFPDALLTLNHYYGNGRGGTVNTFRGAKNTFNFGEGGNSTEWAGDLNVAAVAFYGSEVQRGDYFTFVMGHEVTHSLDGYVINRANKDLWRRKGQVLTLAAGPDVLSANSDNNDWWNLSATQTRFQAQGHWDGNAANWDTAWANYWSTGPGAAFESLSFMRGNIDWFVSAAPQEAMATQANHHWAHAEARLIGAIDRYQSGVAQGIEPMKANITEVLTFLDWISCGMNKIVMQDTEGVSSPYPRALYHTTHAWLERNEKGYITKVTTSERVYEFELDEFGIVTSLTNVPAFQKADTVTAIQNTPNVIKPLENDQANGGSLSIHSFTQPSHGTVVDAGNGTLIYTPSSGYTGGDSFTYTTGAGLPSATVSITVKAPSSAQTGILMETWTGISGTSVSNLTGAAGFPDSPNASEVRSTFEAPVNRAENFGARMQAHLVVPTTGNYTFWIASDDSSQLFLSSDRNEANKAQIASVSGWTGSQQWDKFSSQQSAAISLVAGQVYYIEALHKEGGGGDNLAVAWQGPGITQAVIDGQYLKTVGLNAPVVANAIADVTVDENSADTVIDVSSVFSDTDLADPVTVEVHANTNASLVTASLAGNQLTLSYTPGAHGSADISLRGVDGGGAMVIDTFTVTVNPSNMPPVASDGTFAVSENSAGGSAVGTVSASDPDAGDTLTYAITAGNIGGAFAIDSGTGAITVAGPLNFEVLNNYSLTVTVTDSGSLSDTATITVNVSDVNESTQGGVAAWEEAVHQGSGFTHKRTATLAGNATATVDLSAISGDATYEFIVEAQDTGQPAVHLLDGNGWSLRFEQWSNTGQLGVTRYGVADYLLTAQAGQSVASPYGAVHHVVYAVDTTATTTSVYVDGVLVGTVGQVPDLTIAAATLGDTNLRPDSNPGIHAFAAYGSVLDGAEILAHSRAWFGNQSPVVSSATFAVAENSAPGTAVGTVSATDPNAGDTLTYAITAGNTGGAFAINSGTGAITTAVAPDHEATASYALTVTVTDDGNPALNDTVTITVNVTNVNEAPTASDTSGSVAEDVSIGTSVATVTATDPDAGDTLSYAITAGNTGGAFAIDSSGNITTATALDYETTASYTLTVTVTDSGSLTDTATVNVTVTDVAEATGPKLVRTTVNNVSSASWTSVNLGQSYNSAVIIATPMYPNSSVAPVVTRIRNVSGSGFEVKLDRTDGQTGTVTMDVSVIAVEEGVYTVASDGVKMEAVKYTSTVTGAKNAWTAENRSYQNSYTTPVVVGQVMSANDADWSAFWCHGSSRTNPPNGSNLNVGKMVAEDPDTTRADETVGYIVIESGSGAINGINYTAGLGSDTVRGTGNTSVGYNYSLSGLTSASAAAVSLAGLDGGDGGWAVLYGSSPLSSTTLTIAVDEDQLSNSERNHTTEQLGYIVFE